MQDEKDIEKVSSPFMRAVASRHTCLMGLRESILVDLQTLDGTSRTNFSEVVAQKLDELTDVEQRLYTINKYFTPDESEKT